MATQKEKLQATAEEMGLETEGTIQQLKEAIAAAQAEDGGAGDETPEETATTEDGVEYVAGDVLPDAPEVGTAEPLPEAPVNPAVAKPKEAPPGAVRTYDVKSSFWMKTSSGMQLAQNGGTVRLTGKQAKKYLRHGNIKLAA